MQATRKLGAEHVVYLEQNLNGMAIIASFCDKNITKIRISNETWVIVGSVAKPTITNFHLSCGEEPSSYWGLHFDTSNGKRPRG